MSTAQSNSTEAVDPAEVADVPRGAQGQRVYFTDRDPRIRAALKRILSDAGFEAVACDDTAELVRQAKNATPDVVLLGDDLPVGDSERCLRIFARCYQTSSAVVLITCRAGFDQNRLATLIRGGAFAPIYPPLSRENVVETVRAAAAESSARRAVMSMGWAKNQSQTRRVESNNSLLAQTLVCPFHDQVGEAITVTRYALRAGRIQTETSLLDIPLYTSAGPGADFVNHHLLAVTVCPRCLFASSEADYLLDPARKPAEGSRPGAAGYGVNGHGFDLATKRAIIDDTKKRQALTPAIAPTLFAENRSIDEALISYDLAIRCSNLLIERNRYTLPNEMLRLANYHLRAAHLHEQKKSTEGAESHYRAAMDPLRQAFAASTGPNPFKAAYQLSALAIAFGDDKEAYQYISRLTEMARDATTENAAALNRYLSRAQKLWEDREMHRRADAQPKQTV